jgi:hypothetical protein
MSAEPNYLARLITGESSPDEIHKDLLANFALNCSITALNLQLAGREDAAQIKESLILSWRSSVEAKFAKEVDELRKRAGTPIGSIVTGVLGDHLDDLEEIVARRQKAIDAIEAVARTSILPKAPPA